MMRLRDLLSAIDRAAPFDLQESWDHSGLQVGDPRRPVRRVMVALDATEAVVRETRRRRADVLVTHHPLLFEPLRALSPSTPAGATALELARRNIACIAAHTNYDAAPGGLNDRLAAKLGLAADTAPLERGAARRAFKLVTFVPQGDLQRMRRALFAAGAGRIGDYTECSFAAQGTGTFRGGALTHPTVGRAGRREQVTEWRLEAIVPAVCAEAVVRALRAAHSYEEPALDLYPLEVPRESAGLGRVGDLKRAATLGELVARVKRSLKVKTVEMVGRRTARTKVRRAAVCGGSGGNLWSAALAAGAEVLVTGEMKHSQRVASAAAGLVTLVAGHYATEHLAVRGLARIIAAALPELAVTTSRTETNPTTWR